MIQWFPGHMAKALKQIKEKDPLADLFIVVLDARAPLSSYNQEFDLISPNKPRLFVISKFDLSDKKKLVNIYSNFKRSEDGILVVNLKKQNTKTKILREAEKLLETKRQKDLKKGILKPRLRAIVLGIPNSGKSTLINLLAGKRQAKVGNMPGVTKGQQWINTGRIQLLDTPGILWPKFEDISVGIKLAIIGSIKTDVIPKQAFVIEAYKILTTFYPQKISFLGLEPSLSEKKIYSNIQILARTKNFKLTSGELDMNRVLTYFINYMKSLTGVTYD